MVVAEEGPARDPGEAAEAAGVTLVVKSPAQRHPDLLLPAQRFWSVRRLKAELRRLHPDGPPEDSQRLIYSGKLLPDDLCLQEVLAKHEMVHAVHLVCNSKNMPHVPGMDEKVTEAKKEPATCSQGPSVLPSAHVGSQRENSGNQPSATEEGANRPHLAQHPFHGMNPGYHSYTTYRMLQFWFQQIYARQYYMQYMAASAASSELSPPRSTQEIPVAPVAAPAPLPGAFPAENQPGNQNAPPQVNPGVNQNLRMNAQGGPLMEEDEEGNRDWLDWLYSATLFYVFVNIVYFYSSMSRLLMVMVGTLLMYLHQIGWFPFRRRPAQPAQNNIPPQAAVNQDQNNNLQEENVDGQDEVDALEAVPENEPAAPSFMSTACLFFKAFFVSLLPEGPAPVAN
ncbi:homocysteine-responsive endoplasmic reticulum-resident ubiquitin-like domain member 1 protein isoform X2 [Eublepharis macularius]|uniref:Homocysteine-responsive endoplasmic reticulum-resident ubiquitin-like domain member 1 protein isoform X2 n=1 Tax=Eublepharis macularius TaxID=481883 RepID=A0AA97KGA2_EUBMA|nr:homocysteine-responsive endoplasmic reticulum-resident ubiquitin-like domain member 1 protein isoform X2 [Eublepharis macularius]